MYYVPAVCEPRVASRVYHVTCVCTKYVTHPPDARHDMTKLVTRDIHFSEYCIVYIATVARLLLRVLTRDATIAQPKETSSPPKKNRAKTSRVAGRDAFLRAGARGVPSLARRARVELIPT